jgi:hypothetical protein
MHKTMNSGTWPNEQHFRWRIKGCRLEENFSNQQLFIDSVVIKQEMREQKYI